MAILEAAAALQSFCVDRSWRFCIIGGIALQRWGEPRFTADVDITLLTGFGGELPYIEALLDHFESRVDDAASFALANRVLLLRSQSGVGLDVALGGLPFEERAVDRSSDFRFPPGVELRTCSAEDLIVMKVFAGRGQDWVDVERVIVRQTGRLDWSIIQAELAPLAELKGEPELVDRLAALRAEAEQ